MIMKINISTAAEADSIELQPNSEECGTGGETIAIEPCSVVSSSLVQNDNGDALNNETQLNPTYESIRNSYAGLVLEFENYCRFT